MNTGLPFTGFEPVTPDLRAPPKAPLALPQPETTHHKPQTTNSFLKPSCATALRRKHKTKNLFPLFPTNPAFLLRKPSKNGPFAQHGGIYGGPSRAHPAASPQGTRLRAAAKASRKERFCNAGPTIRTHRPPPATSAPQLRQQIKPPDA